MCCNSYVLHGDGALLVQRWTAWTSAIIHEEQCHCPVCRSSIPARGLHGRISIFSCLLALIHAVAYIPAHDRADAHFPACVHTGSARRLPAYFLHGPSVSFTRYCVFFVHGSLSGPRFLRKRSGDESPVSTAADELCWGGQPNPLSCMCAIQSMTAVTHFSSPK